MSSETGPSDRSFPSGWYKAAFLVLGVVAYQVLIYWLIVEYPEGTWGEGLMAAPLAIVVACVLGRTGRGRVALAALVALAAACFAWWHAAGANPVLLYPVPYVAVYLALLWIFGRTLRRGREPLITRLALHVHGNLPPEITAYTRRVTAAWCLFFGSMALTSILLFALEPLAVWSVFNNLLNLPLVVAMYLCEYAWRLWRYPNFSHASIAEVIRAARNFDFSRPSAGR